MTCRHPRQLHPDLHRGHSEQPGSIGIFDHYNTPTTSYTGTVNDGMRLCDSRAGRMVLADPALHRSRHDKCYQFDPGNCDGDHYYDST